MLLVCIDSTVAHGPELELSIELTRRSVKILSGTPESAFFLTQSVRKRRIEKRIRIWYFRILVSTIQNYSIFKTKDFSCTFNSFYLDTDFLPIIGCSTNSDKNENCHQSEIKPKDPKFGI